MKEILTSYSWIKIASHRDDSSKTWQERYLELEKHHIAETEFLISMIRDLVKQRSNRTVSNP